MQPGVKAAVSLLSLVLCLTAVSPPSQLLSSLLGLVIHCCQELRGDVSPVSQTCGSGSGDLRGHAAGTAPAPNGPGAAPGGAWHGPAGDALAGALSVVQLLAPVILSPWSQGLLWGQHQAVPPLCRCQDAAAAISTCRARISWSTWGWGTAPGGLLPVPPEPGRPTHLQAPAPCPPSRPASEGFRPEARLLQGGSAQHPERGFFCSPPLHL